MKELYILLFIAIVAVGAHFAFKAPKKTNPWMGRGAGSGEGGEGEGEQTPSGTQTPTSAANLFSADFVPVADTVAQSKTTEKKSRHSHRQR
jgi:hypothetical protein